MFTYENSWTYSTHMISRKSTNVNTRIGLGDQITSTIASMLGVVGKNILATTRIILKKYSTVVSQVEFIDLVHF